MLVSTLFKCMLHSLVCMPDLISNSNVGLHMRVAAAALASISILVDAATGNGRAY